MNAPEITPRKTVVARMACAGCGNSVHVKLDKRHCAYYYCTYPDDMGVMCRHKQVWGPTMTEKTFLAVYSGTTIDLVGSKKPEPAPKPVEAEEIDDGFL